MYGIGFWEDSNTRISGQEKGFASALLQRSMRKLGGHTISLCVKNIFIFVCRIFLRNSIHFLSSFLFNRSGAQSLTLSKIVPHICNLLGDPNSQVSL